MDNNRFEINVNITVKRPYAWDIRGESSLDMTTKNMGIADIDLSPMINHALAAAYIDFCAKDDESGEDEQE